MSDKPVYQGSRNPSLSWKEITQEEFNQVSESISKGCTGLFVQVLYPASAYEALKAENEELRHVNLTSLADLHFKNRELESKNESQAKRIAELEKEAAKDHVKIMRFKDALSAYGDPDVFLDDED